MAQPPPSSQQAPSRRASAIALLPCATAVASLGLIGVLVFVSASQDFRGWLGHGSTPLRLPLLWWTVGVALAGAAALSLLSVVRSVCSLAASEAAAQRLACHDRLTGLPNRRNFLDRLAQALQAPLPRCAIFYLDLDGFKEVNDVFGHDAGDLLLLEVAERLRAVLPNELLLARLGGDEFAVLVDRSHGPAGLLRLASRICELKLRPFVVNHVELLIGCSVGVAVAAPGSSAAELLRQADVAMYAAKDAGKGRALLFNAAMDKGQREAKTLEADLRCAIASDQIRLVYQPIVDAATRRLTSVEALARWEHPTRGTVSPEEFIPVAERSGLIVALGERVLREACRQAARWPDLKLSVNLSPVQFRSVQLLPSIEQILADSGLPARRLELEITEGYLLAQPATAARLIRQLRGLGITISLDDFGTGYASIGFLRRFELDRIKLDRSYVSDIASDQHCADVAQAVVALARTLGLPVTAEGVETLAQADALAQIGCSRLQGWLYGHGVDAPAFERQWRSGRRELPPTTGHTADNVFTLPLAQPT